MPDWYRSYEVLNKNGWGLRHGWSKNLYARAAEGSINPVAKIVDLGNACRIDKPYTQDIQTIEYRCPEVILGTGIHVFIIHVFIFYMYESKCVDMHVCLAHVLTRYHAYAYACMHMCICTHACMHTSKLETFLSQCAGKHAIKTYFALACPHFSLF